MHSRFRSVNNQNQKGQNMKLSADTLRRAAELTEEIETKQRELDGLLSGAPVEASGSDGAATVATPAPTPAVGNQVLPDGTVITPSGRRFAPGSLEKIKAAQRRRWNKLHKEQRAKAKAEKAAALAAAAVAAAKSAKKTPNGTPTPAPAPVAPPVAPVAPIPVAA